jgi:hypothetical protein
MFGPTRAMLDVLPRVDAARLRVLHEAQTASHAADQARGVRASPVGRRLVERYPRGGKMALPCCHQWRIDPRLRWDIQGDPSSPEKIAELTRMGEKSARNVFASIERSKERTLDRLLCGLGIPQIGQVAARQLASVGTHTAAAGGEEADPQRQPPHARKSTTGRGARARARAETP